MGMMIELMMSTTLSMVEIVGRKKKVQKQQDDRDQKWHQKVTLVPLLWMQKLWFLIHVFGPTTFTVCAIKCRFLVHFEPAPL